MRCCAEAWAHGEWTRSYDRLFFAAKSRSEFDFVLALVHHESDSHADPFETTKTTFREIHRLHAKADDYVAEVSLSLWLYGHVIEASYPYQIVADMTSIAAGKPHRLPIFTRDADGREISPGLKITQIEEIARPIGLKPRIKPLRASWNANLRNAVFHSNYAIIGSDLYLPEEHQTISVEDAMKRANRALAAFEAFVTILDLNRSHYTEPVEVETTLSWARTPGEKATVVVRAGYGAVAVHDTVDDCGVKSPVILGRMTAEELDLVRKGIFLLPAADKSW